MAKIRVISNLPSALLFACLFMNACAAVKVHRADLQVQVRDFRRDVLTDGKLSQISKQYLNRHYLTARYKGDAAGVIKALGQAGPIGEESDRIYTLAETALAQALVLEVKDPRAAADWYIFAAAKAYDGLFNAGCRIFTCFDPRHERLRLFYVRAVAGLVVNRQKFGALGPEDRVVLGETYRVALGSGAKLVDPNSYQELRLASEMNFKRFSSRSVRRGIGASFVGWLENKQATLQDRYFPPVGLAQALSAVAIFGEPKNCAREVKLKFYDSLERESVEINGAEIPLAADFTAAFGYQVSKSKLKSGL